ncbi:MAG: Gfo/Idh/MocA family oxidoreductase [Zavarzinella sp.]
MESKELPTRRDAVVTAGAAAGVAALSYGHFVHAGESNKVKVALVGAGGRGTGAADQALSTTSGPIELSAVADVFQARLDNSLKQLTRRHDEKVKVFDNKFIGFDAYKNAMDTLRPGDVVILTTPPAFRWVHFKYAIEKGLNVFMEKPVTVDGPSTRKMLELGELSVKKGLKVGVGLMCRHCVVREELHKRIQDGAIGDIQLLRAYRMSGPVASCFSKKKPEGISETLYQIQRFHSFLWASGGSFSDFLIHNIDESCWMKNAWPVKAHGIGGRHYRGDYIDQNFDSYEVEYTFADGTKFYLGGRNISGCHDEFASYAHGTKGSAIISALSHTPARSKMFKTQKFDPKDQIWSGPEREPNPYQTEWDRLIKAIREDKPHNEVKRGAEASLVTAMGRMACHTGQTISWDDALNSKQELGANLDQLTFESPAPVLADKDGKYPVPMPGQKGKMEY